MVYIWNIPAILANTNHAALEGSSTDCAEEHRFGDKAKIQDKLLLSSMKPDSEPWPFDQPRNCVTFTLRQVMTQEEPILFVSHEFDDHSWQFIGSTPANMKDALLVLLGNLVKLDPSILEVADLPPGWHAERESPHHPWVRTESPVVEESEV